MKAPVADPSVGYDDELIAAFLRREISAADLTMRQQDAVHLIVMARAAKQARRNQRRRTRLRPNRRRTVR